jgi:hypothetical protein
MASGMGAQGEREIEDNIVVHALPGLNIGTLASHILAEPRQPLSSATTFDITTSSAFGHTSWT